MVSRSGSQIREDFLRFFEGKGHRRVHSSSLVPANDPTLLFTNAGMNQFKDVFLGAEQRAYTRAVSSQKCVRAGGKHNDLENVGFTRRHHTFFEMLGNFSFGDYFKRDAIAHAWELLTSEAWFGIDPAKLYVTIFEGDANVPRDEEAHRLWVETGVPAERIFAMPGKDNFWQMGETGPCGPCSEIFYDLGLSAAEELGAEGQFVDKPFPEDEQRYVEIWNLVFMQFDRVPKKPGLLGFIIPQFDLIPLPKPSIDTGMGLERIACVLQNKLSNYETDLFTPLIAKAESLTRESLEKGGSNLIANFDPEFRRSALNVIADHARSSTFLIADGVAPSNEGRGSVLRKIVRRALRFGSYLGQETPFFAEMAETVADLMHPAYPELKASLPMIRGVLSAEEERYARTFKSASERYTSEISRRLVDEASKIGLEPASGFAGALTLTLNGKEKTLANALRANGRPFRFPGEEAFFMYETHGLDLDFMQEYAKEVGIEFDLEGFIFAKEEEQARARASWKGGSQKSAAPVYCELPKTKFEGYTALRIDGARVLALVKDGVGVPALNPGDTGEAVLDATSFYADSGGQVGDVGWLYSGDHHSVVAEVSGATKPVQGVFAHKVRAQRTIAVGDTVDTVVNGENRRATERNHTGTHLLHAALREVLGKHVKQAGSLVDANRLRFDFSHFAGVAEEELREIEGIVNAQVLGNARVETMVDVPIDVAVNDYGAMALFGEKYGDRVRVVKIGDFSTELCGGTHTRATGEIGLLKLVGESSVSSGVRRVEAISGTGALSEFRKDFEVARLVGSSDVEAVKARLAAQEDELKKLRRELDALRMKTAAASVADAASSAVSVKGVKVLAQRVDGLEKSQMRELVDQLRGKLGSGIVVLGAAAEGKVSLIVGVTKDLTGKVQAGKIVGLLAAKVGGKGGGRPDLAEAGGNDAGALDGALAGAAEVVGQLLG